MLIELTSYRVRSDLLRGGNQHFEDLHCSVFFCKQHLLFKIHKAVQVVQEHGKYCVSITQLQIQMNCYKGIDD